MGLSSEPVKLLLWLAAVGQQPAAARSLHSEPSQLGIPNLPTPTGDRHQPRWAASSQDLWHVTCGSTDIKKFTHVQILIEDHLLFTSTWLERIYIVSRNASTQFDSTLTPN